MRFTIYSVDHAPDDLEAQLPLRGTLLRQVPGPARRPEYWLAELQSPLSWTREGVTRTISHLVLAARWVGTSIRPGADIPVNISCVTDDAMIGSDSFGAEQAEYVAIGAVKVSGGSQVSALWERRFG